MKAQIGQDLSPAEFLVVARSLNASFTLLLLDKAWTREAELASDPSTRDDGRLAALEPLVDEIDRLFTECIALAPQLAVIAGRDGSDLQVKYEALLTDLEGRGERTAEVARRLRLHVARHGRGNALDYLGFVSEEVQNLAPAEIRNIRGELGRILTGAPSNGDMSPEAEGVVTGLAIAATAEFGPLGGAVVEGIAHVVDCLT
ncbi:hypothetical protein AB0K48_58650 [Nonomuraea sp. NPDC055795]